MNFSFRSPARSYAAAPADTPYKRAQQEWDARMGSAVLSARSWRSIAFGALGLLGVSVISLVAVAMQQRTFVHVVEVSPEGQVMNVRAADGRWTATEAQKAYHLGQFVRLVRSLPTDGVVLRENWLEAYRFLTPQASQQLNEIARDDDPFARLGTSARTAVITSVVQRSQATWQVSWIEATHGADARSAQSFTGLFTVRFDRPRNADALMHNPLGLFITEFSMSPETPASSYSRAQP